jgi:hypothetical protein
VTFGDELGMKPETRPTSLSLDFRVTIHRWCELEGVERGGP